MKKRFSIIMVFIMMIILAKPIEAADVLWRLTHGDQDALVIGEITKKSTDGLNINVIRVINGKINKKSIVLKSDLKYNLINSEPKKGEFCLLSLNKTNSGYKIYLGIYKATSGDYKTLKLIKDGLLYGLQADLTALEWYVNSGGIENDFYFERSKVYLKQKNGQSIMIYPVQNSNNSIIKDNEDNKAAISTPAYPNTKVKDRKLDIYFYLIGGVLLTGIMIVFVRKKLVK